MDDRDGSEEIVGVTASGKKIKCTRCLCEFNSPMEWIRDGEMILCNACYQSLLYPNRHVTYYETYD